MTRRGSVALFGGLGYLGQALHGHLLRNNIDSWIIGRQNSNEAAFAADCRYRSSEPSLENAVEGASTVFHFATLTTPSIGEKKPLLDLENVKMTLSLAEACAKKHVRHLVFASSGGTVYGELKKPATESAPTHPICSYGVGKLGSELFLSHFARRSAVHVTVLRISNVYGGGQVQKGEQGVVSYLYNQIVRGETADLLGDTVRDYIYIEDVMHAFGNAISSSDPFRILNISTGVGTRLTRLATQLAQLMGKKARFIVNKRRPFDVAYNVLRNDRAQAVLNWQPTYSLREGLSIYLREQ